MLDERRVQKKGAGLPEYPENSWFSFSAERLWDTPRALRRHHLLLHPYVLRREHDQLYYLQRTLSQLPHDSVPSGPKAYRSYEVKAGPAPWPVQSCETMAKYNSSIHRNFLEQGQNIKDQIRSQKLASYASNTSLLQWGVYSALNSAWQRDALSG